MHFAACGFFAILIYYALNWIFLAVASSSSRNLSDTNAPSSCQFRLVPRFIMGKIINYACSKDANDEICLCLHAAKTTSEQQERKPLDFL